MIAPQLDLRQHLIREGCAHDEAGVSHGASQVHQPSLSEQDDLLAVGKGDLVDLGFDVLPRVVFQSFDLDLVVEVSDVAKHSTVARLAQMLDGQDIAVARCGDDDIHMRDGLGKVDDGKALHRGL